MSVVSCSSARILFLYFKVVTVKMLPFDNKSEFQVIVDMPNGTTLEQTQHVTADFGSGSNEAARGDQQLKFMPGPLRPSTLTVSFVTTTCAADPISPTFR